MAGFLDIETMFIAASLVGLLKQTLIIALTILNAVLSIIATIAIWKSYLFTGAKILFTILVLTPILGVVVYLVWGQKKVRATG